jgi:DNA-binding NarL/FixJ family response regulator
MKNPTNASKRASSSAVRRILGVEDHPLMREGIVTWIRREKDLEVCGEAGEASQALSVVERLKPDLVLTDFSLPDRSGLELLKDILALDPDLPVLVLSMHDEQIYAMRALRAGARGYVMKNVGGAKLVAAIREVLAGHRAFSSAVTEQMMDDMAGRAHGHHLPLAVLTDREFEVFQLVGLGRTTGQIAKQLHLSGKTVEVHRLNIRRKLKIKSAPELIRYAVEQAHREHPAADTGKSRSAR